MVYTIKTKLLFKKKKINKYSLSTSDTLVPSHLILELHGHLVVAKVVLCHYQPWLKNQIHKSNFNFL